MPSALRRSRRAVPAKASPYNVGDIVEIIRGNTILKGQLVYNLTEIPSSSNPRWLVKFPTEDHHKDEELYEHSFGKVLQKAEDIKSTMPPPSIRRRPSLSSSEGEQQRITKRVTFSESSPTATSDDSLSAGDGTSAREQRSRRRQAKVDTSEVVSDTHNTRKRLRLPQTQEHSNKKMRNDNHDDHDDVVVVKLLTGTLYLYKGPHRRAEFVRQI